MRREEVRQPQAGGLTGATAHETVRAPVITQPGRPRDATAAVRQELTACRAAVINAGGAVVPVDRPPPPVTAAALRPAVGGITRGLSPDRSRLPPATVDGALAGWMVLRLERHLPVARCGMVNHVQTHLRFRGRGIGTALMRRARGATHDETGLERLRLTVRSGPGLEASPARRTGPRSAGGRAHCAWRPVTTGTRS
ncbi:GNAT family N-acetyltransferase [Streptomyces sp. DH-12]|uniref:GNAT family N-acetyltransferase n=2 Tax=unclassified Streptomyces TaxID=2593676 RepID=UPI00313DE893